MNKVYANFPLCAGCSRKTKREGLGENEYYCSNAENVFRDGIITDNIDATSCVRNGWYKSIS